jgi:hypothetical protein
MDLYKISVSVVILDISDTLKTLIVCARRVIINSKARSVVKTNILNQDVFYPV